MGPSFAVYDTVYLRFIDGISTDETVLQAVADALTTATSRLHEVREVEPAQPGANETAYFTALDIADTVSGNGAFHDVALVANPDHGDLPAWVSIVAGKAVLDPASAGGCFVSYIAQTDVDFADASGVPDDTGNCGADYQFKRDGVDLATDSISDSGAGGETVSLDSSEATGVFVFGGTVSVKARAWGVGPAPDNDDVLDATATTRVAVNVTRVAPSPVL